MRVGSIVLLSIFLGACTSTKLVADPALSHPPCILPSDLSVKPQPAGVITAGDLAVATVAALIIQVNELRRTVIGIQEHVTRFCQ